MTISGVSGVSWQRNKATNKQMTSANHSVCCIQRDSVGVLGWIIKSNLNNDKILQKVKGQLFGGKMYKESEKEFHFSLRLLRMFFFSFTEIIVEC